jgi:site-specific DNA recombinase
MTQPTRKRCAIYTRKSTEEGLEMDFNSLDAQREACAAYILSQAGEGWEPVNELYDDGGWSGGSMDRPALKQLLDDIQAGRVDIVVVYKVDRLTRSLADFAKIVEILDARGASFVSVTQAFNTTNSMGRLTLNVLLSFAQFEREVTGERIRDKIAASKRKGMWMGGTVPHGYRVEDRKLVIEPKEAEELRYIFNRYLELKSVPTLVDDLARRGMRTRTRHRKAGGTIGNVSFGKGPLGFLLKNPVFIGKIRHKDSVYDGEHDPIIDPETFDRVQTILANNNRDKLISKHAKAPTLLSGLVTDPYGRPMSPVRGQKGSKQYCYYVTRFKAGEDRSSICRVPAGALEKIVVDSFASYLRKPA